jgi:hypothetical protein
MTAAELVNLIVSEGAIPLAEAARLMGARGNGKERSLSTLVGYCRRGVLRGGDIIRLEAFHGPAGWTTSRKAVERFLARLHATLPEDVPPDPLAEERKIRAEAARQRMRQRSAQLKQNLKQTPQGGTR